MKLILEITQMINAILMNSFDDGAQCRWGRSCSTYDQVLSVTKSSTYAACSMLLFNCYHSSEPLKDFIILEINSFSKKDIVKVEKWRDVNKTEMSI